MFLTNYIAIEFIYPSESGLYPTHFFIALTTTAIFFIILTVKAMYAGKVGATRTFFNIFNSKSNGNNAVNQIGAGDLIALAAAIITLITFIATPFTQQSLLDYHVKFINNTTIAVDILNSGIKEAKNVLISFNSQSVNFANFTTQPYLPSNSANTTKFVQHGNAYFALGSLPSRSFTTVYSKINLSDPDPDQAENLKVYLRTDDSVAYFNLIGIIVFYLILSIAYGISAYQFWFYPHDRTTIFLISIFVLFIILVGGPLVHDCNLTYKGCY